MRSNFPQRAETPDRLSKSRKAGRKLSASRPARMLLLESGTGPGGPISFLRDFALHVNPATTNARIGLYYENPCAMLKEIQNLGFPVTFFRGARPTRPAGGKAFTGPWKGLRFFRSARETVAALELPLALKLFRFIKKERIDVVVLNQDMHFHVPGVIAANLARVPCVCRKAGGIGEAKKLKRLLVRGIDLFVSISKATDEDQRRIPGTKRLVKLYEGLDLARFDSQPQKQTLRHAMKKSLGLSEGRKVVASISRLQAGKGQPEFLRMASQVHKQYPDAIFLIVGDQEKQGGPLMTGLKEAVKTLGIEDAVVFTGWREDIPAILTCVDVFVHCPTTFIEGLARACLEAMAMGIPAVVSDNGGMPDAVEDGVTGFVVPAGDLEAMSSAVLRLLRNDTLAYEFGRRGRMRLEEMFDMRKNARQLEKVVLDCIPASRLAASGAAVLRPAGKWAQ